MDWDSTAGEYKLLIMHYRARTYSPELGRFMQEDPLGYVDGMNLYEYVESNSVYGLDPYGLANVSCGQYCDSIPNAGVPNLGGSSTIINCHECCKKFGCGDNEGDAERHQAVGLFCFQKSLVTGQFIPTPVGPPLEEGFSRAAQYVFEHMMDSILSDLYKEELTRRNLTWDDVEQMVLERKCKNRKRESCLRGCRLAEFYMQMKINTLYEISNAIKQRDYQESLDEYYGNGTLKQMQEKLEKYRNWLTKNEPRINNLRGKDFRILNRRIDRAKRTINSLGQQITYYFNSAPEAPEYETPPKVDYNCNSLCNGIK